MKVQNMTSKKGNKIANQFIITNEVGAEIETVFQSYDTVIAKRIGNSVYLDKDKWDYSVTTSKYRNKFLGETKKETQKKIDNGKYELSNLN